MSNEETISVKELVQLAVLARGVNEEAITFLAGLPSAGSERNYLALQLVRASFDHGRGLLFLLEANPLDMGGPALALHRSQIENFLRGVYLGFIASDEQVQDFLENDIGIREQTDAGKWKPIGTAALAGYVEGFINSLADESFDDPRKFSNMVINVWSPLCGFVHGGRAVHAMYVNGQGEIGGDFPIEVLFQTVCNCFVVTNFGFVALIARIFNLEGIPSESALYVATQRFVEQQKILEVKRRSYADIANRR